MSRDPWEGDESRPLTLNGWSYVEGNPINRTDSSGHQSTEIYGTSISDEFSKVEQDLIIETITRYANLLGGEAKFRSNVALLGGVKRAEVGTLGYDPEVQTILLSLNLYYPTLTESPFGIFQPSAFPNVPTSVFPDQQTTFKFILAHETTHALEEGNSKIRDSFEIELQDRLYVGIPFVCTTPTGFSLIRTRIPPLWSSDPIIQRNKSRSNYEGEVLADVIAAYLYSPALLDDEYRSWIEIDLPRELK